MFRVGWSPLVTRVGLFGRSRSRGFLHCISSVRHLQLRICPGSRLHLLLHRCGSFPPPTYTHVLSQRTIFFLGAAIGPFRTSAIFKFPWGAVRVNRIECRFIITPFGRPVKPVFIPALPPSNIGTYLPRWETSCSGTSHRAIRKAPGREPPSNISTTEIFTTAPFAFL